MTAITATKRARKYEVVDQKEVKRVTVLPAKNAEREEWLLLAREFLASLRIVENEILLPRVYN